MQMHDILLQSLFYNNILNVQNFCNLGNGIRMMSDPQSIVMCRSFHYPFLDKFLSSGFEETTGIRITGRRNGPLLGNAFTDYELESTCTGLVIPSIVIGPSFSLNSTDAPCPGLP